VLINDDDDDETCLFNNNKFLLDRYIMHLEKLLLHCLISITTVVQKHTILQIAEDMHLASDYDTAFMGKDTVPLQFIKMPPMSTFPRTILTRK